jgi:beta-phosphoglucomutase-like phosphatase (HAD superfamily)
MCGVVDRSVRLVLCDADGTLFASEEPAFEASARVTQDFAARYGLSGDFSAHHLRVTTTGMNFRTTASRLLDEAGIALEPAELEGWVRRERDEVSAYLATVLKPDELVLQCLAALGERYALAAVSSSALGRLDACFAASGLTDAIPPAVRYSAEDSLPTPVSKPDPAIYQYALERLATPPLGAVAIEDSPVGARSAVAAGVATVGLLQFVPPDERARRSAELRAVGCFAVCEDWQQVSDRLLQDDFSV